MGGLVRGGLISRRVCEKGAYKWWACKRVEL